ncbi:MAG TPA: cell wall-binding repeat-containing protein [Acidimicrobiales bacterium]|nr:cell wall-binding repeat-containing protein [Acidimicrobiales bacterium]
MTRPTSPTRRRLGAVALTLLAAAVPLVAAAPAAHADTAGTGTAAALKPVTRLAGGDRIGTAIAISQATFPTAGSAKAVILTAAYNFPDALAGAPLAAAKDGPVLLTTPGELSPATLTEIERVAPTGSTVYVLGGDAAIAATIDASLTAAGYVPQRIAGANRFETSVKIAEALGSPTTVLLATGDIFADALSAGPAAASVHGAVLLTDGPVMPPSVATYLSGLASPTVYDVGAGAGKAYPAGTLLSGGDRWATSALVAEKFFTSPTLVGVATGWNFPDALAGAGAMGIMGGPVLLSDPVLLPSADALYLTNNASTITQAFLFGGPLSLSPAIATTVSNQINGIA